MTDGWKAGVDRRAKDTTVDIYPELRSPMELGEDLVEIRTLPDIPQRLGMVQGNNAVEHRCAAIPRRTVRKVCAHEGGNLKNGVVRDGFRTYIADHQIAVGVELKSVLVGNPSTDCNGRHKLGRAIGNCILSYHGGVVIIASWNVNSIRARLEHVTTWLKSRQPDVLLLQELKGTEFPADAFRDLGYEAVAVTQKAYNGVAILSRSPIKTVSTALMGDEADSHARFLETEVNHIRIVNIYLPNGNPPGSENFAYKLAWMDRLERRMRAWRTSEIPVLIGGDFNVIPEDIDCHKPASWIHDALFQPEPRGRFRTMLGLGYTDAFRTLHPTEAGQFTFWDYFRQAFSHNRGIRIDHFLLSPPLAVKLVSCVIDKGPRALEKPSDHTPIVVELDL